MKTLILILAILLFPTLSLAALTDYQFWGSSEEGWYFTTPDFQYYAYWQDIELWAMWIYTDNPVSECLIISAGQERDCSIREFSIILYNFPFKNL